MPSQTIGLITILALAVAIGPMQQKLEAVQGDVQHIEAYLAAGTVDEKQQKQPPLPLAPHVPMPVPGSKSDSSSSTRAATSTSTVDDCVGDMMDAPLLGLKH